MRRLLAALAVAVLLPAANAAAHHGGETTKIVGTNAAETLQGTAGADWIVARSGEDTVLAGGGNDIVDLRDRHGGDRVDCGDGYDRVWVDRNDLTSNCEVVKRGRHRACSRHHHTRKARAAHHRSCRGHRR